MFQQQLATLAQTLPGIGTPQFFYMNEAVSAVRQSGRSEALWDSLAHLPNHRKILGQCRYRSEESASDRLLRVTQSSAYHLILPEHAVNPLELQLAVASGRRMSSLPGERFPGVVRLFAGIDDTLGVLEGQIGKWSGVRMENLHATVRSVRLGKFRPLMDRFRALAAGSDAKPTRN